MSEFIKKVRDEIIEKLDLHYGIYSFKSWELAVSRGYPIKLSSNDFEKAIEIAIKKAREDERIETSKKCDCYIGDIREGRGEFQHSPEENKEGAIVSLLILKKWIKKNGRIQSELP